MKSILKRIYLLEDTNLVKIRKEKYKTIPYRNIRVFLCLYIPYINSLSGLKNPPGIVEDTRRVKTHYNPTKNASIILSFCGNSV